MARPLVATSSPRIFVGIKSKLIKMINVQRERTNEMTASKIYCIFTVFKKGQTGCKVLIIGFALLVSFWVVGYRPFSFFPIYVVTSFINSLFLFQQTTDLSFLSVCLSFFYLFLYIFTNILLL